MDAPTVAAIAAWAAAGVSLISGGIQLWVGRRQATAALRSADAALINANSTGRHKVAEFRQRWIDNVIGTLSEHHAILMTFPPGAQVPEAERQKLSALRTKLEILLNPTEPDTIALVDTIEKIAASQNLTERETRDAEMVQIARRLLKAEWVRIKKELA